MTFVRTLNLIIDEINEAAEQGTDAIQHGDSVLECLNNIIGPETRYEKTDDAVEYLVRAYVEAQE